MRGLSIVNSFDLKQSFWKLNPQFKGLDPFKTLYIDDQSKNKSVSSSLMWGLAFYYDSESILQNLPLKYKMDRVRKEFGGVDIEDVRIKPYAEEFEFLCTSEAERALRGWEEKMRQRTAMLAEVEYTPDNAVELDKILSATPKLFIELQRLKESVLKETSLEGKAMGGIRESASDRGVI